MANPETLLEDRLAVALRLSREEFAAGLRLAEDVERDADAAGAGAIALRALALRGKLLLGQGLVAEACELAPRIGTLTPAHADLHAATAVAIFDSQLAFFTGAYRDAVRHADAALAYSDEVGDPLLRLLTRRGLCIVLGNIEAPLLVDIVPERLAIAIVVGDAWEEAVALNDLACLHLSRGDLDAAFGSLDHARAVASSVTGPRLVVDSVIASTRSQALLMAGRPEEAAAQAAATVIRLERYPAPHPYLLGMTAIVVVEALAAAGRVEEAVVEGRRGVDRLAGCLPLTRSAILGSLADVLRDAGRVEEAYEALSSSVALERDASRQFLALQNDIASARADRHAARVEAERARDEAERDWLTGLHNRRYLSRLTVTADAFGVAVVDVDNFKEINDLHGHDAGDRVLARVGELLLAAARAEDDVIRMGGDEFIVVMHGADVDQARALAERLHQRLAAEDWDRLVAGAVIGTSVGYAAASSSTSLADLIAHADRHLYGAKRSGRGTVSGGPVDC